MSFMPTTVQNPLPPWITPAQPKGLMDNMMNPMTLIGMGLLSANQRSLTPPNYAGSMMNNLMMGQQLKRQGSKDQMEEQKFQLQKQAYERELKEKERLEQWRQSMPGILSPELQQTTGIMSPEAADPNSIINWIATSPDPNIQMKAFEMMMKHQEPKDPIKMGDDTLLDPTTFQPIWQDEPPVNYNQPFLPGGTPNLAYQNYEINKQKQLESIKPQDKWSDPDLDDQGNIVQKNKKDNKTEVLVKAPDQTTRMKWDAETDAARESLKAMGIEDLNKLHPSDYLLSPQIPGLIKTAKRKKFSEMGAQSGWVIEPVE